ncbi:MAG: elongation factor G [Anaerolineaceae bacterium]|nr:elongation factor G [Anaerolineaceae bacterium]
MKEYATESIRNVALVSHSSAGKTMLAEAFLHFTGITTRLGKIEDGTTTSDYDEEEIRRGISLYTTLLPVEYRDIKINFLDTPGYNDFIGEVISALRVSDSALVLLDSVSGSEVGTEAAWTYCDLFKLPRFVVINKMNRENANYQKALASLEEFSSTRLLLFQLPWGEKLEFKGVIDLLTMKAYEGNGKKAVEIPAELKEAAESARQALVEAAAEGEDALMEKYLETLELAPEEVVRGLRNVIRRGEFIPVFLSAGSSEIGTGPLLDAIVDLLPAPNEMPPAIAEGKNGTEELPASDTGPLALYVWKTTADPFVGKQTFYRVYSGTLASDTRIWNQTKGIEERLGTLQIARGKDIMPIKNVHAGDIGIVAKLSETSTGNSLCDRAHPLTLPVPEYPAALYRVAIFPKTQGDSTKISSSLTRLCEEDMTLSWNNEPATNQTLLQGMGDQHIETAIRRAESKFQVGLLTAEPKVPYRETINKKAQAMYRHKKQTGGSGQFGEVHLRIEPKEDGDFELVNDIFGGAISSSYLPAIEKGIRATMKDGILAGFPVHSIRVSVFDGKEHPVDSKPIAFEIAGREAFKLAFKDASPVLEEPIMTVKIIVPEANMGDVLGDLNTRRARVQGMESEKGKSTITASVPLAEMQRYTTQLRSLTGGRGYFTMEFSNYEVVPAHITSDIVAARQKEIQEKRDE